MHDFNLELKVRFENILYQVSNTVWLVLILIDKRNMIQVIPSIAIRKGKVVRMRKGDPSSEKSYPENPLDLALRFADHGIQVIHTSLILMVLKSARPKTTKFLRRWQGIPT